MTPDAPADVFVLRDVRVDRKAADGGFELAVPSLRIAAGAHLALVGESGCGKSTLLDLLAMALQPHDAGAFGFRPDGERPIDVAALWRRRDLDALGRARGAWIGYVLQTGGLIPFLSVRDNIRMPARLFGRDDRAYTAALAERLGIAVHLGKSPLDLSVGERQRVAIARALAHRPAVILADEPTASIDPANADTVMQMLIELVDDLGVTAIVASHDRERVARYGFAVLSPAIERRGASTRAVFAN